MPYLIESNEWRLLQGLGLLLNHRKARYHEQLEPLIHRKQVRPNAELFEFELRRAFMFKEFARNLDEIEFAQCQAKLNGLCSLLDELAWPRSTHCGPESQDYPRLRALTRFLKSTSGAVDLANGPNETLFRLPYDAVYLVSCLNVVTECNKTLSRLIESPPQESAIRSLQRQKKKKTWEKARIRDRTTRVLGTLFEHFRCGTPHEVLLKLIEDPDEDSVLPSLPLMLSPCPELELWHEARCASVDLGETPISSIPNICTDLRQQTNQGRALTLFIEKYGLFGAWASPTSSGTGPSSRESLDQLIVKGAFKRLDLDMLFDKAPPAKFNPKDKRALAIKLGFCLMDFFDTNLTSKRIYFLHSSKSGLAKEFPHLAFGSKLSTADADISRIGHPALLSFAKLLLEIDFGQSIDLDISPHNSQNAAAWAQLLDRVGLLAEERSDSYLQAIRSCLLVHFKIAEALRSRDPDRKSPDSTIRKTLYEEVVRKLELGFAESVPRAAHKRQRSESPPPFDHMDEDQATGSTKSTLQFVQPEQRVPGYKRRRVPEPQQWPLRAVSELTLEETSGHGDNTPAEHPRKCSVARFVSSCRSHSSEVPQLNNGLSTKPTQHISVASNYPTRSPRQASSRDDFEIAIICALPLEYDAVCYIFDEFWDEDGDQYGRAPGDPNNYTTGRIGNYNVVLALLPQAGKTKAASATASMRMSYNGLQLALLVGVCGAVPHSRDAEILLGDVVISKTVIQYDFGRQYPDKFIRKNTVSDNLGRPSTDIRNLLAIFETDRGLDWLEQRTAYFLQQIQAKINQTSRRGKYDRPRAAEDKLFESTYRHKHQVSPSCICRNCASDSDPVCDEALSSSCADLNCDDRHLVTREQLRAREQSERGGGDITQPAVHVGAVASGDIVMKSAADRDRISREAGVIAFEMEGAGVWDEVPSIVVKGVCDYSDCHKQKGWQNFAAATAASASKAILERYIRKIKQ